jgi:hypothetical protein
MTMRQTRLRPSFVEFIPERLDKRILYISRRYKTASHLCCCGCGLEVVTPLNAAKWHVTEYPDGSVSLSPSVGNWSFPCRSHYIVRKNTIDWAYAFSPQAIAAVQAQDRRDAELLARRSRSRIDLFVNAVRVGWARIRRTITNWIR